MGRGRSCEYVLIEVSNQFKTRAVQMVVPEETDGPLDICCNAIPYLCRNAARLWEHVKFT